ncbi:hypothetical protein QFC19_008692 [Naganishia cerealis]|uniref:Uncharacterized protein n=1 Tax=Naganishia cerealis TaxID=610337 RepID=A0ACC2V072_9TREE|nr:hypothetical protein QFC19_008692 [Naganishia cerealis]
MDILITICEFLAGDLAFGTIADVNVANHAVHTDTLSILYETVLFDELSRIYGEDGFPSSLLEEVLQGGAFRSTK